MIRTPTSAIVAVIDRCDAHCVMCNIWKNGLGGEVNASFFKKLPSSLKSINLTGGEPFLRNDLPQIVRVISEQCRKPRIIISTNGLNTDLIVKQMEAIRKINQRVGIRVSIDGIGEIHDKIRGTNGAFEKSLNTLKALKAIKISDIGIALTIIKTADIDNTRQISKVYRLSRDLGAEFTIASALNSCFYFKTDSNIALPAGDELRGELQYVATQELKTWGAKRWIRAFYTKGLFDFISQKPELTDCGALSSFFFLTAHGELYPCHILDQKCGDLMSSPFDEIWKSEKADEARRAAFNCPHKCWMTCTVGNYFRTHMIQIALWIAKNKIKAHLGMNVL